MRSEVGRRRRQKERRTIHAFRQGQKNPDRSAQACCMGFARFPPARRPFRKIHFPDPQGWSATRPFRDATYRLTSAARRAGLEQKVSPTGCAPRTPAMPSTAKPPSTSSRPPWDTRLSPPPALSARASHRKARASICPIDGSHYFLDAKVCAATTPLKTWPKSLISLPGAAASSSPSVARHGP